MLRMVKQKCGVLVCALTLWPAPFARSEEPKQANRQLTVLKGHTSLVNAVAFSPDGKLAASGSGANTRHSDNSVRVWDLEAKKELCRLEGHTSPVLSVVFSHDGKQVISGSKDKTISVWDLESTKELRGLDGHTGAVQSVGCSADGKHIFSCGSANIGEKNDNTIRSWDAETGRDLKHFDLAPKGSTFGLSHVVYSSDGIFALVNGHGTAETSKTISAYSLENGKLIREFKGGKDIIRCMALSSDGSLVLSASYDLSFTLWDFKTGKELKTIQGPRQKTVCVAISPDSKKAISDHADGVVRLWDLETGKELFNMKNKRVHYADARHNIVFSPDGSRALSANQNDVVLWDLRR